MPDSVFLLGRSVGLFALTAVAEIVGCYLPYLWLRKGAPWWLLFPALAALGAFAWLLTLHPSAAGRTYAAYGGVYVTVAVIWLWVIEGQRPDRWDLLGAFVCLAGMAIIVLGPRLRTEGALGAAAEGKRVAPVPAAGSQPAADSSR